MDSALPQLATALDATAMAPVLGSQCLEPGRFDVRDCRIHHVRYKPGRNCLIGYELTVIDRQGGGEFPQLLCGRVYQPHASGERWRKALEQPLVAVRTGPAVTHIPEFGMVVWTFPNERKLRGVDRLLNAAVLRERLGGILGETIVSAEPEVVRYIPEHGCTVRVTAELEDGGRCVVYAKAYADDSGATTFTRMTDLGLRPLAWADRVLWQREVPGELAEAPADLEACARALVKLHSMPAPAWECRVSKLPAGEDAMGAELDRRRGDLLPQPRVILHGDLHLKNFLVARGEAALIDFDTLRLGNPLEDLGSFLAGLYHRGIARRDIDAFVACYAARAGWAVTARDVAWHTARCLVSERVPRAISRRKGDAQTLLSAAQGLLEETETARDVMRRFQAQVGEGAMDVHYKTYRKQKSWNKSHVTVAYRDAAGSIEVRRTGAQTAAWRFPHDPALPWLADAVDPARVVEHLPLPAEKVEVEILNYRPENRCTARYTLWQGGAAAVLYGKTYCDDRGLAVDGRLGQLWRIRGERFPMPRPAGYSAAIRTVWQEAYPGRPLLENLDDVAQAGARLAFLHESGVECPVRFTLEQQLADAEKKMAKLGVVLPAIAPRLDVLTGRLRDSLAALENVPERVVHGDFHLRQLMVHAGEVALFDFDEIATGDPVEDFGHFAADLESYGFSPAQVERINGRMKAGYEQAAGWAIPPRRLAWHITLQLLTRAYRALLQLKPDFEPRVERLVSLAEGMR